MKRVIGLVVLGIGGLAAAIALTVGALALAGSDVGSVVQPTLVPSGSGSGAANPSMGDDDPSSTPSPSVDDHGGAGSPSPDDHSGSGSSGSGSSGSGSGSSGSGSGDSHDD